MKKIIILVLSLLLVSACGMNTAKNAVESYLKKYKTLDSEVLVDLENVIDRENIMAQNLEVYEYMCSSLQNEKQIIDQIISKGIAITKNNQYIINVENIQRFLTSSAVVPMARSIYQEIKMIDKKDNIPSK